MSTGGVFTIITNDGKQDRMLMASAILKQRLEAIQQKRRADPSITDDTPTLLDIERTHVLFMNAHFKPFVAMAYEYRKTSAQTGALVSLANDAKVQFSIPQFGDFFSDMVLVMQIDAPKITLAGNVSAANTPSWNWCDYPGERIIKSVSIEINGNPLDKYTTEAMVFHRKFLVQPNKKIGWDRCMGQQIPVDGYINQDSNTAYDGTQVHVQVTSGPQTPQPPSMNPPPLKLMIPLLFWFNKDPRLAIPSVAIPYGQRYINVEFQQSKYLFGVNLRPGTTLPQVVQSVTDPVVRSYDLYINNIFVNPEIHKIFIKRIGFNLIRVYRYQPQSLNKNTENIILNQLKWPIETMFIGARLTSQMNDLANWHKFSQITVNDDIPFGPAISNSSSVIQSTSGGNTTYTLQTNPVFVTSTVSTPLIDTISIAAHGIDLYRNVDADFFNAYTPYTYGGPNINTPEDPGVMMIPFNLYPGSYQPSGHINLSRAREFYITYTSSVFSTSVTGELIVIASAINFLLISDGSAVLRYST